MKIEYAIEEQLLGTGGASRHSSPYQDPAEPALVSNGDRFSQLNYQAMLEQHFDSATTLTIALRSRENCQRYIIFGVHYLFRLAFNDVCESFTRWRLWIYLAWAEIRMRYRRSTLGPWWITISMAIFTAAISVVYSRLFHQDPLNYMPFLVSGMVLWTFISTCVIESTVLFKTYQGYIKQIKLPYLIYPLRHLTANVIIFGHNFFVYIILLFFCHVPIGFTTLLAIPGFILILINMLWVNLLVALIGTRFRDFAPIIISTVQVAFFITPITWMPKLVGEDSLVVKLNPVVYLLDIFRSPLMGEVPRLESWIVSMVLAMVGCSICFFFFAKYRKRIPFWVE